MPTIYDNINTKLLDGLKEALKVSRRGDFCVGYFNLRGWGCISGEIDALPSAQDAPACRLIVGMQGSAERTVRNYYGDTVTETTQHIVVERRRDFAESLMQQLTYGIPTARDEAGLRKLAGQLRAGKLQVKFFGAYPLHAKLYLLHREDAINPVIGYVGSSNLTLSGLVKQGELNVDVLDGDAAQKLADWFEQRWQDRWCLDITEQLADIIENSWAGGPIKPFEIYIKTAYQLSKEAIEGAREFRAPKIFRDTMLAFQHQAVSLAAERLNHHDGVIISDVVGLGKTLIASAVAKTFQEDRGGNVLVICPPKLEEMWKEYLHTYQISGATLSLGKFQELAEMRRYPIVIIDESHNLRNREAKRYARIQQYLRENDSRVILLTATPYNKTFTDIANQLRLFVEADSDLGIRPDEHIRSEGVDKFKSDHPNTLITSLAAFEHSESIDDWRELMRMFMVRRTRSHIKKNYAEYDQHRKQHYLTFHDGNRYYFPDRTPKCAGFSLDKDDGDDQYALLYSPQVVTIISGLSLPRYGIGKYLLPEYQDDTLPDELTDDEKKIIKNLSRAGNRLIGFAKSGLFKRLESSGPAFLLSIKRHIVRNAVYLSAWEQNDAFPIGDIFSALTDETVEENEDDLFSEPLQETHQLEHYLEAGRKVYQNLRQPPLRKKFQWIKTGLFKESLAEKLLADCRALLEVLDKVPHWDAEADRKLGALATLCQETHGNDKLLIFTQFKDTADYLYRELAARGVEKIAEVFGGMDDISGQVRRFSPLANGQPANHSDPLRVLITTDTLSEGQNLQDAHIVVNFDLPWAIIRLIQRAGRVDRIGQQAREILCYCFLPEEGIDRIIDLRKRLQNRIRESAELIGSDEKFFEGDTVNLKQVYDETLNLEEQEDETDLISRAYDIWRQAIKNNPALKKRIEELPDVVYSSKHNTKDENGILAYIKTNNNQHLLAQVDDKAEIISQSQSKILTLLECSPDEPLAETAANHHKLVAAAVSHVKKGHAEIGGQLGGTRSIRHRVYGRLSRYLEQQQGTLFDTENLKQAIEQIYRHPFKETVRDQLKRQLLTGIPDQDLAVMVVTAWESGDLSAIPKHDEPVEPQIICSMGLVQKMIKSKKVKR